MKRHQKKTPSFSCYGAPRKLEQGDKTHRTGTDSEVREPNLVKIFTEAENCAWFNSWRFLETV